MRKKRRKKTGHRRGNGRKSSRSRCKQEQSRSRSRTRRILNAPPHRRHISRPRHRAHDTSRTTRTRNTEHDFPVGREHSPNLGFCGFSHALTRTPTFRKALQQRTLFLNVCEPFKPIERRATRIDNATSIATGLHASAPVLARALQTSARERVF